MKRKEVESVGEELVPFIPGDLWSQILTPKAQYDGRFQWANVCRRFREIVLLSIKSFLSRKEVFLFQDYFPLLINLRPSVNDEFGTGINLLTIPIYTEILSVLQSFTISSESVDTLYILTQEDPMQWIQQLIVEWFCGMDHNDCPMLFIVHQNGIDDRFIIRNVYRRLNHRKLMLKDLRRFLMYKDAPYLSVTPLSRGRISNLVENTIIFYMTDCIPFISSTRCIYCISSLENYIPSDRTLLLDLTTT